MGVDHIRDPTPTPRSDIAAFYERHPYPPPRDELNLTGSWSEADQRGQSFLFWPDEPFRDDRRVLIAGCGTTQAARFAARWPKCEVVAIDVSATSLRCTKRLMTRHGLKNLQIRTLAVEDARELDQQFDHVVCTGVLHHLPVPAEGLAALRDVLAPGGAMNLMVYAPYGRAGVYLLQDYCRRLQVSPSASDLRDLAATLSALPAAHPLAPLLRSAPDFQTEVGLADALLHPQDRAYSTPELFALLAECGLQFGRWLRQAPYLPQCGAPSTTPHRSRLMQLPEPDRYAAMELFRGVMVRHSLIAYRADRPPPRRPADWSETDWAGAAPLRLADTVVVRERLPAGAVAVLINRAHPSPDLYLPLGARAWDMFCAIDGVRTCGELAALWNSVGARATLTTLWEYDHVVFHSPASGDAG